MRNRGIRIGFKSINGRRFTKRVARRSSAFSRGSPRADKGRQGCVTPEQIIPGGLETTLVTDELLTHLAKFTYAQVALCKLRRKEVVIVEALR